MEDDLQVKKDFTIGWNSKGVVRPAVENLTFPHKKTDQINHCYLLCFYVQRKQFVSLETKIKAALFIEMDQRYQKSSKE